MFFKQYPQTFKFSETDEEAFVDKKDIILKLSKPIESHHARFHRLISFPDDLSDFTLYSLFFATSHQLACSIISYFFYQVLLAKFFKVSVKFFT
ncbi:unnamed protein product, partial [Nesidiocoris tenuis]